MSVFNYSKSFSSVIILSITISSLIVTVQRYYSERYRFEHGVIFLLSSKRLKDRWEETLAKSPKIPSEWCAASGCSIQAVPISASCVVA